jgi:hypothetical protein
MDAACHEIRVFEQREEQNAPSVWLLARQCAAETED